MARGPAMALAQGRIYLAAGRASIQRARAVGCDLFVGGEMGIGNTSASSLVAAKVLGLPVEDMTGRGTGLDDAGLARKRGLLGKAAARTEAGRGWA